MNRVRVVDSPPVGSVSRNRALLRAPKRGRRMPVAKSDGKRRGDVSRRKFLERLGLATAVGGGIEGGLGLPTLCWADEGDTGPVDCGPPPQAKPQHQTGGESFPPLPLPATPLRRSEKKRPPSPPALIGKAALGNTRWITKDGKRVQYRDWMTDPADVMTLLSWTAGKLGINYRAIEVDFAHFSFDPRELPVLLFAGHNKFALSDELRPKLARFVMDGGTILGDACCGWKDFADSFRREMELIFPDRPLHKMLPDEPVYSSYYKLGNLTYKKGRRLDVQRAALPRRDRLRLPGGRDLLAARSDLRLGRPRASPRHPRGDRRGPAGRRQPDYLHPRHVPAWAIPEHDQGLSGGGGPQPRRFRLRPVDARGRLGSRPVGRA